MRFLKLSILGVLLSVTYSSYAQEQPTYATLADKRFEHFQFAAAAPAYEKMASRKIVKPQVLYRLAYSYDMMQQYQQALNWYKAYMKRDSADNHVWLRIGDLYKTLQQYDSAKIAYTKYSTTTGDAGKVKSKIAGCDSALVWLKNPQAISLVNEANINTNVSDWGATFYGSKIVFASEYTRENILELSEVNKDNYGRTGNPYLKLYVADPRWHNKQDTLWQKEKLITDFSQKANAYKLHTGPVVFTKRLDTAYFTVTHTGKEIRYEKTETRHEVGTRKLELFYTVKDANGRWEKPVPFAYNNAQKYSVGAAALSNDGSILYFTSDMPGSVGKTDIWFCVKQADGNWSDPKNCGPSINTADEEAFPTLAKDNTLYFSSKGHPGMGGLDIFSATGSLDKWSTPANLKAPLNSSYDDFYFSVDATMGYLSSDRPGGAGNDDIYSFVLPEPVKPKPAVIVVVLNVIVKNETNNTVIEKAGVQLTNKGRNADWQKYTDVAGTTAFLLEGNSKYTVKASREGLISDSLQFETGELLKSDTIYKTLVLKAIPVKPKPEPVKEKEYNVGDRFVLEDLYYDFDKSNIRPDAALVLDKLIVILEKYPTMEIELSSHTDSRGNDNYNLILSQKRATSAVQYLIAHGIKASRVKAKGYGETRLLNRCKNGVVCTDAEHQLNRRTEVMVLKK